MADERRSYPRHPVRCAVQVALNKSGASAVFAANSTDLSLTSMQLACKSDLVTAIIRQPELPHRCQLEFVLPWHTQKFRINAQMLTHRRVSQDNLMLVLQFVQMDKAQEAVLANLLDGRQRMWLA